MSLFKKSESTERLRSAERSKLLVSKELLLNRRLLILRMQFVQLRINVRWTLFNHQQTSTSRKKQVVFKIVAEIVTNKSFKRSSF